MIDDDILDNSKIRRAKTCWHKVSGMERTAINDMLMLENGCHLIINRFFGHLPCYSGIMQTVTETFMVSLVGHLHEFQYNDVGLEDFTLERFNYIQLLKGSFYRFYKPAAVAMLLAG